MKQQYGTVRADNVRPRQKANGLMLGPGKWSLSSMSSVPYVRLIGPSNSQKEFSWGEIVEVPQGASAQVENASYHVGDIVLSGGADYAAIPNRVTVPAQFIDTTTGLLLAAPPAVGVPTFVRTAWKVDCRRARRAFLILDLTSILNFDVTVRGYAEQRTHRTANQVGGTLGAPAGTGYLTINTLPAATAGFVVPLGARANVGVTTEPHALLDSADATFAITRDTDAFWPSLSAYYVLEY